MIAFLMITGILLNIVSMILNGLDSGIGLLNMMCIIYIFVFGATMSD